MRCSSVLLVALALAAAACRDSGDRRQPAAPATATATTPAQQDTGRETPKAPLPPQPATASHGATAMASSADRRPTALRKARAVEDGAATARGVFERAQRAFTDHDDATTFHCVVPATRKRWLGNMVFSGDFAAMGRSKEQGARRAALDELRASLDRYGATLSMEERLAGLTVEALQTALMRKVTDPAGLYAELLGWAARQGAATDPMQALTEPQMLAPQRRSSSSPGDAGPSGMAGVLSRLASGARVGEMKVQGDTATATIQRDVQRFVRLGGAWFLDE